MISNIKLRWFAVASLGSFVALDVSESGQLVTLVSPMNADGTRADDDGETTALDEDTRSSDPTMDAVFQRALEVGRMADEFRSVLRSWLTEPQLVEVDARNAAEENKNICHTHDFCDANMAMLEAFETITAREFKHGDDHDSALFNEAWALASADKFATPTVTADDFGMLEKIVNDAAEFESLKNEDLDAILAFAVKMRKTATVPPFDPSTDADDRRED